MAESNSNWALAMECLMLGKDRSMPEDSGFVFPQNDHTNILLTLENIGLNYTSSHIHRVFSKNTVGLLYPQVSHPWIQPTLMENNIFAFPTMVSHPRDRKKNTTFNLQLVESEDMKGQF